MLKLPGRDGDHNPQLLIAVRHVCVVQMDFSVNRYYVDDITPVLLGNLLAILHSKIVVSVIKRAG